MKKKMGFVIQRAAKSDIPQILEILDQWNMKPVAPGKDMPDPERSRIDIEKFFVARSKGEIVGVAGYIVHTETYAETASLAVDKKYEGRGIGGALQIERMRELWKKGIKILRTEADRAKTIAWYKKHFGYVEIGRNPKKHNFSLNDVNEWVVLECDLHEFFQNRKKAALK